MPSTRRICGRPFASPHIPLRPHVALAVQPVAYVMVVDAVPEGGGGGCVGWVGRLRGGVGPVGSGELGWRGAGMSGGATTGSFPSQETRAAKLSLRPRAHKQGRRGWAGSLAPPKAEPEPPPTQTVRRPSFLAHLANSSPLGPMRLSSHAMMLPTHSGAGSWKVPSLASSSEMTVWGWGGGQGLRRVVPRRRGKAGGGMGLQPRHPASSGMQSQSAGSATGAAFLSAPITCIASGPCHFDHLTCITSGRRSPLLTAGSFTSAPVACSAASSSRPRCGGRVGRRGSGAVSQGGWRARQVKRRRSGRPGSPQPARQCGRGGPRSWVRRGRAAGNSACDVGAQCARARGGRGPRVWAARPLARLRHQAPVGRGCPRPAASRGPG
jgi:hypothetical protein